MTERDLATGGTAPARWWRVRLRGGRPAVAGSLAAAAFLLSPPLLAGLRAAGGQAPLDVTLAWNVGMSLAWVAALHLWVPRWRLLHLALLPLWLTTLADLFLLLRFDGRLSTAYLLIAVGDAGEAGEFLSAYRGPIAALGAGFAALYAGVVAALRGARLERSPRLAWAAAALLLAGYAGPVLRQARAHDLTLARAVGDVAGHDLSSPAGVLSQAGVAASLAAQAGRVRAARAAFRFDAVKAWQEPEELYVLVIGESSRPDHWSLGGYARDTTPRLAARRNLLFLDNVVTTAPSTGVAVPSLLSLGTVADWPALERQRSVLSAFSEAGLETAWFSTQEVSQWGGIIPDVAREAGLVRYFDRALDGHLVEEVRRWLGAPPGPRRAFLVLHTRGSHFEFRNRYPPRLRRWPEAGGSRVEDLVNSYDNSVLYTDEVLADLIGLLEARGGPALLVYASDHGENLLDDERQLFGHAMGTRQDLSTAAFVWWSERLADRFPERVALARARRHAGLSLGDVPHLLLDVAGVRARGLDPARSIFNPAFREASRHYLVRGELRAVSPAPLAGDETGLAGPR